MSAGTIHAQVIAHQKVSDTSGGFTGILDNFDDFSESLSLLGDLDGDGVPDLAVGAEDDDDGGMDRGAVYILFLNTDGTVKAHQKISDTSGGFTGALDDVDEFGQSVAGIGDLDGDGTPDLAVGVAGDDDGGTNRGAVWILFLNTDGTVKAHQKISDTSGGFAGILSDNGGFAESVAALGDFDGDNIRDIAVGAKWDDDGGTDRGAVWILFLNTDGTVKAHQKISDTAGGFTGGLDNSDELGQSVAGLGDLDGDGIIDIAVGAKFDDDGGTDRGAVWILFLNADGTVKAHQKISQTAGGFAGLLSDNNGFAESLAPIGDLNGDTIIDIAVGAEWEDDGGFNRGAVWMLFLDTDGTVKAHQKISGTAGGFTGGLDDGDEFGQSIVALGDVDGDGQLDVAVGADGDDDGGTDRGAIYILFSLNWRLSGLVCETGTRNNVDENWVTVNLDSAFTSPIVIASPNYDDADPPIVVRIRNSGPTGFEMRAVNVNDTAADIAGIDVYYLVVEEGVYTQAEHGITMEARRYPSTVTDFTGSWLGQSQSYLNSYTNPVVLGQVMTENDAGFSVFWCRGVDRQQAPTASTLFTGKHVGEDGDTTRADETIGLVVVEAGTYGSFDPNGLQIAAGVGPAAVSGVADAPPYTYSISGISDVAGAVVSQAGMRGGDGSWALLYGANPLSDTAIDLAVDEDQLLDPEQTHVPEQVAYLLVSPADADRDGDGDVDGRDLAAYLAERGGLGLAAFAGVFGSLDSGPANQAPVLDPIGNKSATETQPLTFGVTASDTDGPAPLILNASGLPGDASFTDNGGGSGIFSWTPAVGNSIGGPYAVTFTATDDNGNGLASAEIISISVAPEPVNQPPVLDPIGDQMVVEGQTLTFTVTATDTDGPGPLVLEACGLPENAQLADNGDGTGLFTWTPAVGDAVLAPLTITIRAIDDNGSGAAEHQTLLIDVQPAASLPDGFQQDPGSQGLVSMEAEHYHAKNPFVSHNWTANPFVGASGPGALEATPNSGTMITSGFAPLSSPRLDFKVNFVNAGTHYVWVRGYGPDTGGDSIHVGLNGTAVTSASEIKSFNPSGAWVWSSDAYGSGASAPATIDIPSTGVHTINAWMREDGFIFDKILLTTDPDFVPTGIGPPESATGGTPLVLPYAESFDAGPLDDWQFEDDAGNASAWMLQDGSYQQQNQVRASSRENLVESYHLGSFSYLTTGMRLQNYRVSFEMTPAAETGDDIGCMIRYRNPDNYYRLSIDSRFGYTRLEKRVAGQFTPLASNAIGYTVGEPIQVSVTVNGSTIYVDIDDNLVFTVEDSDLTTGTVAFYSAAAAAFDSLLIEGTNYAPTIGLSYPLSNTVVAPSTFSVSAVAASEPCGSDVVFLLDGAVVDVVDEAPYITQFASVSQGYHQIEAVLRQADGTTAAFDQNIAVGVDGDDYVATGDSITNGAYDTYQTDNLAPDNPSLSFQGYTGPLGKALTETNIYPSIVVNEGIGGDQSGDLLNIRIDSILERNPELNKLTVLIGTNDSEASMPATKTVFANNIQGIVDKIKAKNNDIQVVVGITPPAFGSGSTGSIYPDPSAPEATRNVLIRDYRDAITQNVTGIDIGPDFFKCFLEERNLFSLFVDNLHPNGLGYDYMTRLWHDVLTGAMPYTDPCPPPRFILLNLEPSTHAPYIKQNLIEVGDRYYIDEAHTVSAIPSGLGLENGVWIMTPNADATNTSSDYITFTIDRAVDVYVAYDIDPGDPSAAIPDWLLGYTDTQVSLPVSDPSAQLHLFNQTFPPGDVTLGGNLAQGANAADVNYIVIVVEQ
ncbi:GDSL-type esterase/lipase family protein [Desulfosarcina sp.]|uniref:GDSL-type esterase/lipase family protein n=1 Tax=Desulfosarcina sp. TaxID=2027861 RepID=UPI0035673E12